ncbi:MAG TPA: FAD-binding oxidoreductase [Phycisphaerae bacterium]|nr:FAD-binding oxidoreductase [Phycisphaerae bacterium]
MIYLASILVFGGLLVALAAFLVVAERFLLDYGVCQVSINTGERVLEIEGGQTLLEALNGREIYVPSACGGQGTCGYCKVTVSSGGGPVLPTERPLLDRKEIRAGVRLACRIKVRGDLEIRIPEEILNVQLYSAEVEHTRDLTYDTKEIRLRLLEPPAIEHRPGQYIQIQAPSPQGPVWRAYSISSPVYEPNAVELVVRLVPGGIASTYLHNLKEGDPVTFTGPFGEFRLNEDPETEIVCVAGGCGMAPVKNIIYSLCHRWPGRSCRLFFGCRTTRDIYYLDEFRELAKEHPNFRVVYALSEELEPEEPWDGETGFIHLAVDKYLEPGVKRQAFLCGPPVMIEAVQDVLAAKGLEPDDVFFDDFGLAAPPARVAGLVGAV